MTKRMTKADEQAKQLSGICSSQEAAELLGMTADRVTQLCRAGRIAAKHLGRDWAICRAALLGFAALHRPVGRPRAAESGGT